MIELFLYIILHCKVYLQTLATYKQEDICIYFRDTVYTSCQTPGSGETYSADSRTLYFMPDSWVWRNIFSSLVVS